MRTKRKISVTVDTEIFKAIEEASRTYDMAKSHLVQEAFRLWLRNKTEELMAQGYAEMVEEDKSFAELSLDAQREVL